jgi:hypothetical protein
MANITKELIIPEMEQRILELAEEIAGSISLRRKQEEIQLASKLSKYLRVLESNSNIDGEQLQQILSAITHLLNKNLN